MSRNRDEPGTYNAARGNESSRSRSDITIIHYNWPALLIIDYNTVPRSIQRFLRFIPLPLSLFQLRIAAENPLLVEGQPPR